MQPNETPTQNIQQNPLQIKDSSYFDIITGSIKNPSLQLQQDFFSIFSLEQTQTEKWNLKLQHQKRLEAANQILWKHELERTLLLTQLNQNNILAQMDNTAQAKTQLLPSTSSWHAI